MSYYKSHATHYKSTFPSLFEEHDLQLLAPQEAPICPKYQQHLTFSYQQ